MCSDHSQFQGFGGTIGLAQAAAVLNSKVTQYIAARVKSGAISPADAQLLAASSVSSVTSIASLPSDLRIVVQDAFRDGTRWLFISLIPWAGVTIIMTLLLSRIVVSKQTPESMADDKAVEEKSLEENRVDSSARA